MADSLVELGASKNRLGFLQSGDFSLASSLTLLEGLENEVALRMEIGDESGDPLEVDLSVGNSSTGELDDYIREQVVRLKNSDSLLRMVKFWASARHISKALFTCLNSLSWALLVLFFF